MFLQNKNRLYVCNRIEQKSCPDSTIKNFLNSETMKKVFLSATALSLVFMSCSNDDFMAESANSTKDVQTLAYMARQQTDLTTVINEVQNKCRGINGQGTALITAVEETAMQISSFEALVDENYKTPTLDELNTPVGIAQMSYRAEVKDQLLLITKGRVTGSYVGNKAFSESEQELLETCRLMEDNGGGDNDNSGDTGGVRTITAFAYGYQQSRANAVIMAVLVS